MQPNAAAASCINPLPSTDVSIELRDPVANLLLGALTDIVFDIANNGTENATNVNASFTLPTNASIDSIAATAGTCSQGAGTASCSLGTIGSASSQSVAITVLASAVGSDTLGASVTADGDSSAGNNQQSVPIVVDPAVDLAIANAGTTTVIVDNSTTIRPTVENTSSLAASNVVLNITFSSGLRVDSASWPGGTCTVGTGTVDCQAASLGAQSSVMLEFRVTATAVGSRSYTATVSSSEADANAANNEATGSITVQASQSGSGSDSGGGGLFGPMLLLLMALARLSVLLTVAFQRYSP
jgi:hypothetical protein